VTSNPGQQCRYTLSTSSTQIDIRRHIAGLITRRAKRLLVGAAPAPPDALAQEDFVACPDGAESRRIATSNSIPAQFLEPVNAC
jgi:hypothetical protein